MSTKLVGKNKCLKKIIEIKRGESITAEAKYLNSRNENNTWFDLFEVYEPENHALEASEKAVDKEEQQWEEVKSPGEGECWFCGSNDGALFYDHNFYTIKNGRRTPCFSYGDIRPGILLNTLKFTLTG